MPHLTDRLRLRTATASLAAAALLGLGAAAPASASTTEPEFDEDRLRERLELACARVPLITDRATDRLERIRGDADTRGSLAWLEEQADRAREAGRDERAERIEQRLDVREELEDVLVERLEAVDEAAEFCADEGLT